MKQSLSYYITILIIKLKGIKKDFSKDPIDFEKIRREDIHHPKEQIFGHLIVSNFMIASSSVTEVKASERSNKLVIFIHGGAFISGPAKHHWDVIMEIARKTDNTVWMCDYPKAPEHKISEISENIDLIYSQALEIFHAKEIVLIGDSVGGTLVTALTQRLLKKGSDLPDKIILVSPVMDATLSNSEIDKVDLIDPILSKRGVLSAKKMCVENNDLRNEMISPINGCFENFPDTVLYMAENDITYPDQKLVVEKLRSANVNLELIEGKGMPHVWPFLPVMKEAKKALEEIIGMLN